MTSKEFPDTDLWGSPYFNNNINKFRNPVKTFFQIS